MNDKMKALINAKQIVWIDDSGYHFTKNKTYPVMENKEGRYITTDAGHNIQLEALDILCWKILDETPDPINHPSHYTDGKIEVIDFIEDKNLNYLRGNVIKYVSRAGKKDKSKELEDLKKAAWYLNREIQKLEENGNQ